MKEACGVFGVLAPGRTDVAQLCFDGLFALQHRGQESAGMAVSDGETITVVKDMGLVSSVFDERTLACLPGYLVVGHTRYSTAGPSTWHSAQPVYRGVGGAGFALAHNGNLTNTRALTEQAGMLPGVLGSDSDLVAELIALEARRLGEGEGFLEQAVARVLPRLEGAFSFVLMDARRLIGARDPHGFRPLCLGRLDADGLPPAYVLASETPALDVIGARLVREVAPGEMIVVEEGAWRSVRFAPVGEPRLCVFEFVYFARPDSILLGREVHGARRRMGELLAARAPAAADLVMGVPDSGVPAAEGYARASGIPYGQGLVKNRYIGRTFITPGQQARDAGVRRKLNPLHENIAGRRLVVVDDSIVRGTTTRAIVRMLREAGAAAVHLRISSPPFRWPCFYGIDTPTRDELLAARLPMEEIERFLEVDSLAYLDLEDLLAAIEAPEGGFCTACLTGAYPVAVRDAEGSASRSTTPTGGDEPAPEPEPASSAHLEAAVAIGR
jgi:amidophosphoribosyltransferase